MANIIPVVRPYFDSFKHESKDSTPSQQTLFLKLENESSATCGVYSDCLSALAIGGLKSEIHLWKYDYHNVVAADSIIEVNLTEENSAAKSELDDSSESGSDCESKKDFNSKNSKMIRPKLDTLIGHSGPVCSLKLFVKNNLLLSSSGDGTVKIWDINETKQISNYSHSRAVYYLDTFEPDNYFASACRDGVARLWSLDRKDALRLFVHEDPNVTCCKFNLLGNYLCTGSGDAVVRLYNVSDGRLVRLFRGHTDMITHLSFSPDGKYLASADARGNILIWNLQEGIIFRKYAFPPARRNRVSELLWKKFTSILYVISVTSSVYKCDVNTDNCLVGGLVKQYEGKEFIAAGHLKNHNFYIILRM